MDLYAEVRSLPFPAFASLVNADITHFSHKGHDWVGPCPLHKPEKNITSFRYGDDGRFNCFSCKLHGSGAIDLLKLVLKISLSEAVELLNPLKGYKAPENPVQVKSKPLEPSKLTYHKHFVWPCPWLEARGITEATAQHFGAGLYNNPKRKSAYSGMFMLPVRNTEGEIMAYLARNTGEVTEDKPKYRFPLNFPKSEYLFGAYELVVIKPKVIFLVESPFCVMKFHQLGFPACSPYGWSISDEQISILGHLTKGVIYLPDQNKRNDIAPFLDKLSKLIWVKAPDIQVTDPEQLDKESIMKLL